MIGQKSFIGSILIALLAGLVGCRPGAPESSSAAMAFSADQALATAAPTRPKIIANPTMSDLMQAGPLGERTMGRADAPVTVIEYASLTCPYCRAFHERTWPTFKRTYIDTGKVHFILREFPIGRSSGNAWLATRCAPEDKFFELYEDYLKSQHQWVSQDVRLDAIYRVAQKAGMSRATFDSCLTNQKIIDGIKWSKQRGRQLGVVGTPTFFINEKKVPSIVTMDEMRALIDPLFKARVAADSGS
ncbi:MAG: DsbA family protein [Hyphomicrobiaceae bacterium]